jgi:hypothetical protein
MTVNNPINRVEEWRWECIKLTYNSNVETDTGWDLPKYGEVDPYSMMVFVQTIDATETLEVGLLSSESGGDADGFLDAISIATAGWVRPAMTFTKGSSQYYVSACTWGEYFFDLDNTGATSKGLAGADGAGTAGQPFLESHIGDGTAKSLTYTCTAGSDTFVGFLMFRWRQLPDLTGFLL